MAAVTTTGEEEGLNFEWDDDVVGAIVGAIEEIAEIYELSSRIKAALPDELPGHVKSFIRALDYDQRRSSSRRASADDLYGPMLTTTDGYAYPEPLSEVTPETAAAWADAAQLFDSNDVVVARLGDLLWCIRVKPRPDLHARAAQARFGRQWGHKRLASVHRSDAMVRALEIANELGDAALVGDTAAEMVAAIHETLADGEWAPGVALPMLEALAGLPESRQPAEVDDLIRLARSRYAGDPFILESLMLLEVQRAGSDVQERKRIAAKAVEMWRTAADERGGLVGLSHLERALELAQNEGLGDKANELRGLLQKPRSADELGMQKVSSDISIPSEVIEGFVNSFVTTSGPEETIARLATHSPITDVEADMQTVRNQMQEYPFQHLFSAIVTNDDGTPIAHITTDQQKFDHALNQHHSFAITFWGNMLGLIFERLRDGGMLPAADLARHIESEFVDAAMATGITKAYDLMLGGEHEAAMHMLLVRIERTVRHVARTLGLAVFREPSLDGKSMGAYKGLGELLSLLEGRVPEHHRRYLAVLLTERTSLNLRNRSAHGLMDGASIEAAALALHALLVLSRWSTSAPPGSSEGE
jgi:hypothetical protein